jgi:hypothetical protein
MAATALYDAVIGAYTMIQVMSTEFQSGLQAAQHHFSGNHVVQQVDITLGDPVVTLGTSGLAALIAAVDPVSGLLVTSGTVTIPLHDRSSGGLFGASGSDHSISFTDGLLVPVDISASQDDDDGAIATCAFHGISSTGLAQPVTHNASATLASQTFTAIHDLGPVKVNSTIALGITSSKVNFGINVQKKRYEGEPFVKVLGVTINEVRPSIEFTFEDMATMHSFAQILAVSSTVKAFYRKRTAGGLRVADATTEHVACTLTGGLYAITSFSASGRENHAHTATVYGKTLAFASDSAIS